MNKRIILIASAILVVFTAIFLLLPTSYQITVHSSRYFENCSSSSSTSVQNQCKTFEPPKVIEKREPYISAWWNKTQTERTYAVKEVTVQWSGDGQSIYRKTGTGVLKFLVFMIPLLILAGMVWLFIFTLLRAIKLKGSEQIAWVCLIIFLFPIGSIIFLIAKPKATK